MGDVRALNLWLSLSRCGDESPGLDIVPRRLDDLVAAGTEGTFLSYQVSQQNAEEAAGDTPIVRPIFEPGDALFFDELCLHQTGVRPVDAEPALRDRELVLRRLGVPRGLRPDRGLVGAAACPVIATAYSSSAIRGASRLNTQTARTQTATKIATGTTTNSAAAGRLDAGRRRRVDDPDALCSKIGVSGLSGSSPGSSSGTISIG